MKRFLIIFTIALFCLGTALAQTVPDDKAIQYAKECQSQGLSIEQAVRVLQSKGVSIDQMKRLKSQYENGSLDVGDQSRQSQNAGKKTSSKNIRNQNQKNTDQKNKKQGEFQKTTDSMAFNMKQEQKFLTRQDSLNRIYGHDIFRNENLTFEPNIQLATPTNYVIGAGDELGISIYGSSEVDLSQMVTPEGRIFVSGLGPISLKGLTVDQARTKLLRELSTIYSGLSYGTASLTVTVSNIRSIQINVMGEVTLPGTYTLPSLATVFHALYAAGGVTEIGTLRDIKVMRNNKIAGTVDIYRFLASGDKSGDIVLQDGDVVLVSPYVNLVSVEKGVKRPMHYEMKVDETVGDLVGYAGGFTNTAFRPALNIVRQNDQGLQAFNVKEPDYSTFKLSDGDKILVGERYQRSENQVIVDGAVYNPGTYAIDGVVKSVKELITAADGLREDAFMDRALLQREMADWSLEMQSIDLNKLYSGEISDIQLRANDKLFIASKSDMREDYSVSISGPIAIPGEYNYAEGMTIKDLIVQSGGLLESASLIKAEVSRRIKDPKSTTYSPVRTQLFTVTLGEGLQTEEGNDLVLEPFDMVYIRKSPTYNTQRTVTLNGEVLFAGSYALEDRETRVSDILTKAGGPTPSAFIVGSSLQRKMTEEENDKMNQIMEILSRQASRRDSVDSKIFSENTGYFNVGFDLAEALAKPGSSADIILQPGDIINVPEYNGTVQILGSVLYPNAIAFEEGKKLKNYIKDAGGYSQLARKNKVFVLYMNGTAATGKDAKIIPGCKIVVPMKSRKEGGASLSQIMGITTQTASMASIVASMASLFR